MDPSPSETMAPDWFWYALSVLLVTLGAVMDSRIAVLMIVGSAVYAGLLLILVRAVRVDGDATREPPRRATAWVLALLVGLSALWITTWLPLWLAGFRYALTVSFAVVALAVCVCGPLLTRRWRTRTPASPG
jgi:hypothetical protein